MESALAMPDRLFFPGRMAGVRARPPGQQTLGRLADNCRIDDALHGLSRLVTDLTGARFGAFHRCAQKTASTTRRGELVEAARVLFTAHGLAGPPTMPDGPLSQPEMQGRNCLIVPLLASGGEMLGAFILGHPRAGVLTSASAELAAAIAAFAAIAIVQAQAREQERAALAEQSRIHDAQVLLLGEMNHRVKNVFSLANAVVMLSARASDTSMGLAAAIGQRLSALARAHDLILAEVDGMSLPVDRPVSLFGLLRTVMAPYQGGAGEPVRIAINGFDPAIHGHALTSLALVFHEFATNAAKYGALSGRQGRVDIATAKTGDDLILVWTETGGPPIAHDQVRSGFGRDLEQIVIHGQLKGQVSRHWEPGGLCIALTLPLARLA